MLDILLGWVPGEASRKKVLVARRGSPNIPKTTPAPRPQAPPGLASTKSLCPYPLAERDSLLRQRHCLSKAPSLADRANACRYYSEPLFCRRYYAARSALCLIA